LVWVLGAANIYYWLVLERALEALRAASRERCSAANARPACPVLILNGPSCDIKAIRKLETSHLKIRKKNLSDVIDNEATLAGIKSHKNTEARNN
jgi:hypothetical protein